MFTDLTGKKRLKVNLHMHTTISDGSLSPEEATKIYKAMGYDAITITDHWKYQNGGEQFGVTILPGCEYNIGYANAADGVFHVVSAGAREEPELLPSLNQDPSLTIRQRAEIAIRKIREKDGLAILAHPAWSLNTAEDLLSLKDGFDATEIYNSVSECGMSDRPYSGIIIDQMATKGFLCPLVADDDTHYYTGDEGRGFIMVEADAVEELGYVGAIKAGKFYSSQGPELHVERVDQNTLHVRCSPVSKIVFLSNVVWTMGRVQLGENLTEAIYHIDHLDTFVRVEITDKTGKCAWSNCIKV